MTIKTANLYKGIMYIIRGCERYSVDQKKNGDICISVFDKEEPIGYWIKDPLFCKDYELPDQVGLASCSLCHIGTDNCGVLNGYSHCPHCGALMNGYSEFKDHQEEIENG